MLRSKHNRLALAEMYIVSLGALTGPDHDGVIAVRGSSPPEMLVVAKRRHRWEHLPAAARTRALPPSAKLGMGRIYAFSAARTRSGLIGYSRMRAPVASKNALAIAPTAAPITSSPAPVERSSSRCTTIGVT